MVQGLGFGVWEFYSAIHRETLDARAPRARCLEGWGFGFRIWGLEFRVWGLGVWVLGVGFRDWGFGLKVWGLGFRV